MTTFATPPSPKLRSQPQSKSDRSLPPAAPKEDTNLTLKLDKFSPLYLLSNLELTFVPQLQEYLEVFGKKQKVLVNWVHTRSGLSELNERTSTISKSLEAPFRELLSGAAQNLSRKFASLGESLPQPSLTKKDQGVIESASEQVLSCREIVSSESTFECELKNFQDFPQAIGIILTYVQKLVEKDPKSITSHHVTSFARFFSDLSALIDATYGESHKISARRRSTPSKKGVLPSAGLNIKRVSGLSPSTATGIHKKVEVSRKSDSAVEKPLQQARPSSDIPPVKENPEPKEEISEIAITHHTPEQPLATPTPVQISSEPAAVDPTPDIVNLATESFPSSDLPSAKENDQITCLGSLEELTILVRELQNLIFGETGKLMRISPETRAMLDNIRSRIQSYSAPSNLVSKLTLFSALLEQASTSGLSTGVERQLVSLLKNHGF